MSFQIIDSRLAGSGFGVRIRFFSPEFGFDSVLALAVRIRVGFGTRGSDSDQIGLRRFGLGSEAGSVRVRHPNPGLSGPCQRCDPGQEGRPAAQGQEGRYLHEACKEKEKEQEGPVKI